MALSAAGARTSSFQRTRLKVGQPPPLEYWKGILVSVESSKLGSFQGFIDSVDAQGQTVTLSKPFHNGKPYEENGDGKVTIRADTIENLKILKIPEDEAPEGFSVISRESKKRPVQNLNMNGQKSQANTNYNGYQSYGRQGENGHRDRVHSPSKQGYRGSPKFDYGSGNEEVTGSGRKENWKKKQFAKDDACFGMDVDNFKGEEFDFEKNLALFNKQAVFDEITANQKQVVKRQLYYRHDESVLKTVTEENYTGVNNYDHEGNGRSAGHGGKLAGAQRSAFTRPDGGRGGPKHNNR